MFGTGRSLQHFPRRLSVIAIKPARAGCHKTTGIFLPERVLRGGERNGRRTIRIFRAKLTGLFAGAMPIAEFLQTDGTIFERPALSAIGTLLPLVARFPRFLRAASAIMSLHLTTGVAPVARKAVAIVALFVRLQRAVAAGVSDGSKAQRALCNHGIRLLSLVPILEDSIKESAAKNIPGTRDVQEKIIRAKLAAARTALPVPHEFLPISGKGEFLSQSFQFPFMAHGFADILNPSMALFGCDHIIFG
jgi:hypothetical protein